MLIVVNPYATTVSDRLKNLVVYALGSVVVGYDPGFVVLANASGTILFTVVPAIVAVLLYAGSASTLDVMNTRPVVVAAQALDVLNVVRSIAATAPPARSPQNGSTSRLGPSSAQSPQLTSDVRVQVLQTSLASATLRSPSPKVLVRYAVRPVPANIVPLTFGSLITGE